jgi:carbon storage regulator
MLVLTRRADESINIGDDIVLTILGIEGDKVKIGIKAPRSITILREEVYLAVQAQTVLETRLAEGLTPDSFNTLRELLATQAVPEEATSEPAPVSAETPVQQ